MYTIVVVDDEEELRRAIIKRIDWEQAGFQVVGEADNGIEALELVEKQEPDLLLTDIHMPFLSGLELARQVREIRPATQIAFLSGYDDFAYAQQAIQYNIISYLLKPITMADLTKELLEIKKKLDVMFEEFQVKQTEHTNLADFVMPLLLDNYQSDYKEEREKRLLAQAVSCGLIKNRRTPPHYVVMITMLCGKDSQNCTTREHVHSVDTIVRKYVQGFHFYSERKVVSLLLADRTEFEKYLHILAGDISQSVERILGQQSLIGISRVTETLAGCHEAYREAVEAAAYSAKNGGVHYIADEEHFSEIDMKYLLHVIGETENLLRGGGKEELKDYLTGIFDALQNEGASQAMVRFLILQLFSTACQTVYVVSGGAELRELQDKNYMQRIASFDSSLLEAEEQVIAFCLEARELIASQRKKSSKVLCEQAVQIIDTEFSNPALSLMEVSGRINVSPNYLSALIKKYQGKTFTDLLTGRRMEAARQLLLCTPMKIREVAEKCGYSDQHYFSYCFKKYAGISPNAMRQKGMGGLA